MSSRVARVVGSKQFKVWALMATTLVVGVLLGFGRWAEGEQRLMGFGDVVWGSFPASWLLVIEYGVLVTMVAGVIKADRVDALFSSKETLVWLGGICLFTAGLYHDHYGRSWSDVWGSSVNGYGSFTVFLRNPSFDRLPLLLSVWPMAYGGIVAATSFMAVMGSKRTLVRCRWILNAVFLFALTLAWFARLLWPVNLKYESSWLTCSLGVLPLLVITLALARNSDRKIHWINVIAAVWLLTALFPQFTLFPQFSGPTPLPISMSDAFLWMGYGYRMLLMGDLLILGGSTALLLSKNESGEPIVTRPL